MDVRPSMLSIVVALLVGCGDHNAPLADASVADLSMSADNDLSLSVGDLAADFAMNDGGSGSCNNLVNAAPVVQQTVVNQPMPTPAMGGAIAPGTYFLTDSKIYQGAPPGEVPLQLQVTQTISGAVVQTVQHIMSSPNSTRDTRTYSTSATTLTISFTCGGNGSGTLGFDATTAQYVTYNNAGKIVNVWTRQ